jgi:hypothetical protein
MSAMKRTIVWCVAGTLCGLSALAAGQAGTGAPAASVRAFVEADSQRAAETAAARLDRALSFDEVWRALKAGRAHRQEPSGRVDLRTADFGVRLDNVLEVPEGYTPDKRWPLRVSLHGGVGRPAPGVGDEPPRPLSNRTPGRPELVLHPRAFAESEWWTWRQVQNVLSLLDVVKRRYNVDESRVYLTGISDGGTGAYFLGMRAATPWAACLPLNGHPSVLANPDVGADGQLYVGNLANCPLRAVNGGRDRLYPAASVRPLVEMLKRGGIPIEWQVYEEAGHDVSWWGVDRSKYEAFLAAHVRDPHPGRISWQTERVDRYNRFRWLVINALGARPSDTKFEDVNRFAPTPQLSVPLYDRDKPSGRVDVARDGNAFDIRSSGVRELTLLLSPDVVDFAKAVVVTANGREVHRGVVTRSVATLATWAALDNDRTMLYAAELRVTMP